MDGECSGCGTGTRYDTRTKLVTEENGGSCIGESERRVECYAWPQQCAINGKHLYLP